jgi:hypothetical protein
VVVEAEETVEEAPPPPELMAQPWSDEADEAGEADVVVAAEPADEGPAAAEAESEEP